MIKLLFIWEIITRDFFMSAVWRAVQDACQLRAEVTPMASGTLQLTYAILPLTDMLTPGTLEGSYMGQPKLYSLINKKVRGAKACNLRLLRCSCLLFPFGLKGHMYINSGSCDFWPWCRLKGRRFSPRGGCVTGAAHVCTYGRDVTPTSLPSPRNPHRTSPRP